MLAVCILAAISACGGSGDQRDEIAALRQELAEVKETQVRLQKALASLQETIKAPLAQQASRPSLGPFDPENVFQIPIVWAPRKGNEDAPVTVVEFADFQCPYCQAAAGVSDYLLRAFPDDVQFAFKHYPLGRHVDAVRASKAAWAAQQQGKFWEMHNLIYRGDITQISDETLRGYAQELGLDMIRFESDRTSAKAANAIVFDKKLGRSIKLAGTPSFFVNGRRVTDRSPAAMRTMIEQEIAKQRAAAATSSPEP